MYNRGLLAESGFDLLKSNQVNTNCIEQRGKLLSVSCSFACGVQRGNPNELLGGHLFNGLESLDFQLGQSPRSNHL
jgi:hypothetical protein